jgi:predicted hydrocarbon binding protein
VAEISCADVMASSEEIRSLVIEALREGFRCAFEELARASGPVDAMQLMKPHVISLLGYDFKGTVRDLRIGGNGPEAMLTYYQTGQRFAIQSEFLVGLVTEKGGVGIVYDCPFKHSIPELCICLSHFGTEAVCSFLNDEYECIFTHHLTNGDPYCRYVFKKKSQHLEDPDDIGSILYELPKPEIPPERLLAMQIGASTMFWDAASTAYVLMHGDSEAEQRLLPLAYEIGCAMGRGIKETSPEIGRDAETLGRLIMTVYSMLDQKGTGGLISKGAFAAEVTECSCRGFSPVFCSQISAMVNGVVFSINPEYEFAYSSMITQGDKACQWTVAKKAVLSRQDPLAVLKIRLAKGEITKEEYLEMKNIIGT